MPGGPTAGPSKNRNQQKSKRLTQNFVKNIDDLLEKYALSYELERVRTTNMGTLYELTYKIVPRENTVSKEFLDALRTRNGNLNIVCGKPVIKEAL